MTQIDRAHRLTDLKLAARANGQRFFDVGEPCARGHYSRRYASNGGCVECITGKADKPLSPGQAAVSKPYLFRTVVPLTFSAADIAGLEPYLVRCMDNYAKAKGCEQPPYSLARVQWAEYTGRPMSEAPI